MRKIIVGAQVSMDGVMQAPGGPWEDPTKGFNRPRLQGEMRSPASDAERARRERMKREG